MVGFSGDQETINETCGSAWLCDGRHHDGQIHIGSDDMRGLAQVDRLADNHIIARFDLLNDPCLLVRLLLKLHIVAHRHRVSGTNAIQTNLAAQTALPLPTRFVEDNVPAAR